MRDHNNPPPKRLEHFLTKEYANKYSERWYGIRWLKIETMGNEEALGKQIDRDIARYDRLRRELMDAVSECDDRAAVTERWIYLLKPRIERLDFWASLWGALISMLIAGLGVYALLWSTVKIGELNAKDFLLGLSLFVSFFIGMFKFDIERKKLWYKYVLCHLEAISKIELPASKGRST